MLYRLNTGTCCLLLVLQLAVTTVAFVPPQPLVTGVLNNNNRATTTPLALQRTYFGEGIAELNKKEVEVEPKLLTKIWNRMDTLEASGINDLYADHPPLVQRGGGFKRFMIIMGAGMAYKWYRARFINKIPFWEKQPQWNMVVTNKEQEDALRAYTCQNCGSTLFIARNREWYFEGGTGLAGLGCYSCGAKGRDNFVMDRDRLKAEMGADDDYFDYERPLDFVTAAERQQLLKQTAGDEEAANRMLVNQAAEATKGEEKGEVFGISVEEAEAKKKAEAGGDDDDENESSDDDEEEKPRIIVPPAPDGDDDL